MPLPASGPMMLSQVLVEFGVPPGPRMLTDLYRGGSFVRKPATNNNAVDLATGVPEEGPLLVSDFYGVQAGFAYTHSTPVDDQFYMRSVFGDDWAVNYPKIFINDTTQARLLDRESSDPEVSGALVLINNGEVQGLGGAGGTSGVGSPGTYALYCHGPLTIINNGAIRAGGGGGGRGGTGGQGGAGSFQSWVYQPASGWNYQTTNPATYWAVGSSGNFILWSGTSVGTPTSSATTFTSGIYTYERGPFVTSVTHDPDGNSTSYYRVRRRYLQTTNTTGGLGGAGGDGASGRGYEQTPATGANGSAGSPGGTNAGTGGTGGKGGDGGEWGQSGNTGNQGDTGTDGNAGAGLAGAAGSAGGAPGPAIAGPGERTILVAGTIQGTT